MRMQSARLRFTGERLGNQPASSVAYQATMARYQFAAGYVAGLEVLDIACATGYGSHVLAQQAARVTGADVAPEVIERCRRDCRDSNLEFVLVPGDQAAPSLESRFDCIVSLETVEHARDPEAFLRQFLRYLKAERGTIVLSTPNNYQRVHPPANRFHLREFDILELLELLRRVFEGFDIALYGQTPTNVLRSRQNLPQRRSLARRAVARVIRLLYDVDLKHFNLLRRLEGTALYKRVGSWQRDYAQSAGVYAIDPASDFLNPVVSVYVLQKHAADVNTGVRPETRTP